MLWGSSPFDTFVFAHKQHLLEIGLDHHFRIFRFSAPFLTLQVPLHLGGALVAPKANYQHECVDHLHACLYLS